MLLKLCTDASTPKAVLLRPPDATLSDATLSDAPAPWLVLTVTFTPQSVLCELQGLALFLLHSGMLSSSSPYSERYIFSPGRLLGLVSVPLLVTQPEPSINLICFDSLRDHSPKLSFVSSLKTFTYFYCFFSPLCTYSFVLFSVSEFWGRWC